MNATVSMLRPAVDTRPAPTTCECPHPAHRAAVMFGPTSRFLTTGTLGHARDARMRTVDTFKPVHDSTSPRVCWECFRAGHLHDAAMRDLTGLVRALTGCEVSEPIFDARVAGCTGCSAVTAVATVILDVDGVVEQQLCAECIRSNL